MVGHQCLYLKVQPADLFLSVKIPLESTIISIFQWAAARIIERPESQSLDAIGVGLEKLSRKTRDITEKITYLSVCK